MPATFVASFLLGQINSYVECVLTVTWPTSHLLYPCRALSFCVYKHLLWLDIYFKVTMNINCTTRFRPKTIEH